MRALYRYRRTLLVLVTTTPVVLLAGVWLLVTRVLLAPAVPDVASAANDVAQFIMAEQGLPRLNGERAERFLQVQVLRFVRDADFRARFLQEVRTATPEQQEAFRSNLFHAIKPIVMRDVQKYDALDAAGRGAFLDDRIVAYNRLNALRGDATLGAADLFGAAAPSPEELAEWWLSKTTEPERRLGIAYAAALQARIAEILADPPLRAEFEARIAAPAEGGAATGQ